MKKLAERSEMPVISFSKALKKDRLAVICEVKKASPSKGIIKSDLIRYIQLRNMKKRELTLSHVLQRNPTSKARLNI